MLKGYKTVKAKFTTTNLTMSVNVLEDSTIDELYNSALRYFKSNSSWPVKSLSLYPCESDMHSNKNFIGMRIIN